MTWKPPSQLGKQAIMTDRYDRKHLHAVTKDVRAFGRARRKLNNFTTTGTEAVNDAFFALFKAVPELVGSEEIAPAYRVNRMVAEQLATSPALRRLREFSVGDPVQAADSTVSLETTLEGIFDRLAVEQQLAEELQELAATVTKAAQDVQSAEEAFDAIVGSDPDDADLSGAQEAAEALSAAREAFARAQQEYQGKADELNDRLEGESGSVRLSLHDALSQAADDAASLQEAATAWGLAPGQLTRLPAAERLALAKRINNERMRAIANLFGRMRNLALSQTAEQVADLREEIVDLEFGGDLDRAVPAELLMLAEPATEMDFLSRWSDRELLSYATVGTEQAGRGGIIYCHDGSGSMRGQREMWGKALMLVLLHLAREQRRTMHIVHFGAKGQILHLPFTQPEDFTADRIMEAAEAFWASGTDFETPMRTALDILRAEYAVTSRDRADVVFVADDECWVADEFMAEYLAEMHHQGARTWAVDVTGRTPNPTGAMARMSEGRLFPVRDLYTGRDLSGIFSGVS